MIKLILTLAQKTSLESGNPYGAGPSTLQAWPLLDGTYVLPPAVINAPDFASIKTQLEALPQRDVGADEYPPDEEFSTPVELS